MYVVVSRETDSKFASHLYFYKRQLRLSLHAKWEVSNIFTKNEDMENWLLKNKIPFNGDLLKTELMLL